MTYTQAIEKAKQGRQLMLPKWNGYFQWDYGTSSLYFKNGQYISYDKVLEHKLDRRDDWYFII